MSIRLPSDLTPDEVTRIALVGEALTTPQGQRLLEFMREEFFDRLSAKSDDGRLLDDRSVMFLEGQRAVVQTLLAYLTAFETPRRD